MRAYSYSEAPSRVLSVRTRQGTRAEIGATAEAIDEIGRYAEREPRPNAQLSPLDPRGLGMKLRLQRGRFFERLVSLHDHLTPWRSLIGWRGKPLHDGHDYSPFFIIGANRSGTTLLRRMLMAHGGVFVPPESDEIGYCIRLWRQNSHLEWRDLVYLVLGVMAFRSNIGRYHTDIRSLAEELLVVDKHRQSLGYLIDRYYRHLADNQGRHAESVLWGDKTPSNTFKLHRIESVFPNARYIHLYRDGCDVVRSLIESELERNASKAAQFWVDSIAAARDFGKAAEHRFMELRYEDLVTDPTREIESICSFLEIDYRSEMATSVSHVDRMKDVLDRGIHRKVTKTIDPSNIGRGRAGLGERVLAELGPLMDEMLRELGYARCDELT